MHLGRVWVFGQCFRSVLELGRTGLNRKRARDTPA